MKNAEPIGNRRPDKKFVRNTASKSAFTAMSYSAETTVSALFLLAGPEDAAIRLFAADIPEKPVYERGRAGHVLAMLRAKYLFGIAQEFSVAYGADVGNIARMA